MGQKITIGFTALGLFLWIGLFCLVPLCTSIVTDTPEAEKTVREFMSYVDTGEYEKAVDLISGHREKNTLDPIPLSEARRSEIINEFVTRFGRDGEGFDGEISKMKTECNSMTKTSGQELRWCSVDLVTKNNVGALEGEDLHYAFTLVKVNETWTITDGAIGLNIWKF